MIRLTPETLAAAYDYLATMPPFDDWNLPDSSEIRFSVIRSRKVFGQVRFDVRGHYEMQISSYTVRRHISLLATVAHEQCHIFQHSACFMNLKNVHDRAFWMLADDVCKHNPDFDRAIF
jgi:hypothetical protein